MSGMLDATHQADKPQDYKDQVFIGKVVVNDDIKMFHRIKVEIPDMWDEYDQEHLPWCIPHALAGGSGSTETSQNIPETGSFVYVTFQNGDNHNPVYYGGVRDFKTVQGVLAVNYPHRVGWQLNSFTEDHGGDERHRTHTSKDDPTPYPRFGHHFFVDRSTNEVEYKHATETNINVADNGRVFLEVRARDLPDGGDFITHTDRHYVLEVSNAKFAGDPGHYRCKVLEDYWHTEVQTWVKLESLTDKVFVLAPEAIRIESSGSDVQVKAGGGVAVQAVADITLKAGGDVAIDATSALTVRAPTTIIDGNVRTTGNVSVGSGASGVFMSADGQVVTVVDGIVVNIV